jgi:nucleoside-diphosphate-sugar epimerase
MKTLYATGISGTIGKHLPDSVRPVDLDLSSIREEFRSMELAKDSHLIHLAGIVGPALVEKDIQYSHRVNVEGVKFLATEFLDKSNGTFYYVSTSHVYAPSLELLSENSLIGPVNLYAEQKREAEIALESIFTNQIERLCIIRVFSVLDWDTAVFTLGGAIRKLASQDPNFTLRNAADIRDFLTPKTIANALFKMAETNMLAGVVNLCSGVGISVGEAAKKMLLESGIEPDENKITWEKSASPFVVGDNSLLSSLNLGLNLSWSPSKYLE